MKNAARNYFLLCGLESRSQTFNEVLPALQALKSFFPFKLRQITLHNQSPRSLNYLFQLRVIFNCD